MPPGANPGEGADAVGPDGVGQKIELPGLDEHGRVIDEGDGHFIVAQRTVEVGGGSVFDVLGPGLITEGEQHLQGGPETVAAGMGRIEKPGAVAMIGWGEPGHGWQEWGCVPFLSGLVRMISMRLDMRSL